MTRKIISIICLSFLFVWQAFANPDIPAFPGAEGFGAKSVGGRGGKVLKVTNLNDSGPGSLRAAVEASGPRIVVFEVSGTINLSSTLSILNPFITIAGQTSPGGICIAGRSTVVNTNDVIIQHIRFRPGSHKSTGPSDAETLDAVKVLGNYLEEMNACYNVIFDHCSFSWAIDENVDVFWDATDITFQWCIFAEGLMDAGHPKENHSMGLLISGKRARTNVSVHHSYFAHNVSRNPLVSGAPDSTFCDFVNNVVYHYQGSMSMTSEGAVRVNWVHNYVKKIYNFYSYFEAIHGAGDGPAYPIIFCEGNLGVSRHSQSDPQWSVGDGFQNKLLSTDYQSLAPWPAPPVTTTEMSYEYALEMLENVGATKPVRDAVDERIVADFAAGTGKWVKNVSYPESYPTFESLPAPTDNDNDGMADAWEISVGLDPTTDDSRLDRNSDGYTNIEEYLHYLTQDQSTNVETPANSFTPVEFALEQNYPNPFNPSTIIKYRIPNDSFVSLKVFDLLGNEAATLVEGDMAAGSYSVEFDGSSLQSGVYFYRIQAGEFSRVRQMVLLK